MNSMDARAERILGLIVDRVEEKVREEELSVEDLNIAAITMLHVKAYYEKEDVLA